MAKVGGIVLAAGKGERMRSPLNKVYLPLGDDPVIVHSLRVFEHSSMVDTYVIVAAEGEVSYCRTLLSFYSLPKLAGIVPGGDIRQESVAAGLKALPEDCDLVVVHDGARPLLTREVLEGGLQRAQRSGAVVVAVPAKDTVKVVEGERIKATPERSSLWLAQTPQIFRRKLLQEALDAARASGYQGTDDASLVERLGYQVDIYPGTHNNIKITTPEDIKIARALMGMPVTESQEPLLRTGLGYDVHPFEQGRPLYLGGIRIPEETGLKGHSDGDVLLHALIDACLGAAALPDIGHYFPPSDPRWEGAYSLALLQITQRLLASEGFRVVQVDLVVAAQKPRLAPYIEQIRSLIATVLNIPVSAVGLKATTTEGLGFVGREEGIACWAVATIQKQKKPSP